MARMKARTRARALLAYISNASGLDWNVLSGFIEAAAESIEVAEEVAAEYAVAAYRRAKSAKRRKP